MQLELDDHLKQLLSKYNDLLTPQHRIRIKKMLPLLKNVAKSSKDLNISEEAFYGSMREQIEALDRKIKNTVKFHMSDYQAFRWWLKKEGKNHSLPDLFRKLKISDQILPETGETDIEQISKIKTLSMTVQSLCNISIRLLSSCEQSKYLFDKKDLHKLVNMIAGQYNITSYHNFTHGVSVQILFKELRKICDLDKCYDGLDLFLAEIAALVHDMGHKGFNSMWEIKRKSKLALLYEEESVLQKMHLARFFRLLKQHSEIDFFQSIKNAETKQHAKNLVTSLVLSTDMSKHFKALTHFQELSRTSPQLLKTDYKYTTLELIFHGCDIGNPCMQFEEYINWSILLAYQFNNQAIKQEKQNIGVTHGFRYSSVDAFYHNQTGFITSFCLPIWRQISNIFPEASAVYKNAERNAQEIEKLIKHKQIQ